MRVRTARSGPPRSRSGSAWATPWSPTPSAGWSEAGRVVEGELRPDPTGSAAGGLDFCDAEVLRTLRRRSLAALRAEVEPVPPATLARFLPVAGRRRRPCAAPRACSARSNSWPVAVVPASAAGDPRPPGPSGRLHPGPARRADCRRGEVLWAGHGSLPGDDGWVSLHVADLAHLTSPAPDATLALTETHQAVLDALAGGGAYFFRTLSDAIYQQVGGIDDDTLLGALWDLAWAGSSPTTPSPRSAPCSRAVAPRTAGRHRGHGEDGMRRDPARSGPVGGAGSGAEAGAAPGRPSLPARSGPPSAAGRWSLLPPREADATVRAYATAEILLERYGVVTRGSAMSESVAGRLRRRLPRARRVGGVRPGAPRLLRRGAGRGPVRDAPAPWTGCGRRPAARAARRSDDAPRAVVLAACDPANPFGAALPWPDGRAPADSGKRRPPDRAARRQR